jgi:hypothetical protein
MSGAPAPNGQSIAAVGGYAFGDSTPAARRLALLAEVFEPTSRAFLDHVGTRLAGPPGLAVDLGCGPGHTTRLLSSVLGRGVLGLTSRRRSWPWPPPTRRPGSSSPSTT